VLPDFDARTATSLYLQGDSNALSGTFLRVLRYFRDTPCQNLDAAARTRIDDFVALFLALLTEQDFQPTADHQLEFVRLNATISNLVALSSFQTTDPFLARLGAGPADFAKLLALCSARNRFVLDRRSLFDADPVLACAWYGAYAELYRTGLLDPIVYKNLREHFAFQDDRLDVRHVPMTSYFASTYVGGDRDRQVRSQLNRSWHQASRGLQAMAQNRPDPGKIAVLSSGWSPTHSAYRITKAFVESLQEYHLTFVPLGSRQGLDLSLFDEVRPLAVDASGVVDIRGVLDNDFTVAYYPEVGLSTESILLTNLRIAPVQIASLGHSVSTWGSEIDYFFSGNQVEPAENPERNYSERLVLLPGLGAVHERPDYTPAGGKRNSSEIILNCPWNAQKLGHPLGLVLQQIVREASTPIRLRFFVSASLNQRNDYWPFVRDLQRLLGSIPIDVIRDRPYGSYMALMEQGDLNLDSYPFGGCNTVVDSLFLRKLTVCYEGDLWYNRIGPALLRLVGLPELIATSDDQYVQIVLRLIRDQAFREQLQSRLDGVDLDATLFDRSEARMFRKAVDWLVTNHERLRGQSDRSAIRIASLV
jgi:hypothetical protein